MLKLTAQRGLSLMDWGQKIHVHAPNLVAADRKARGTRAMNGSLGLLVGGVKLRTRRGRAGIVFSPLVLLVA